MKLIILVTLYTIYLVKNIKLKSKNNTENYLYFPNHFMEFAENLFTNTNGIILIYSQYIDSGLIPMALALEEAGFTRFGDKDAKSLFKKAPTEVVDVRTMKPPANKKEFMPARYAMITGDPRLSPNNDFEVKGLTNDNNKDGHKIKVILI